MLQECGKDVPRVIGDKYADFVREFLRMLQCGGGGGRGYDKLVQSVYGQEYL